MGRSRKVLDMSTNEGLRQFYDVYNRRYFGNRLPRNAVIRFECMKKHDSSEEESASMEWRGRGGDRTLEILVDERLRGFDCIVSGEIVHEMAHADVGIEHPRDQHGPRYQKRMLELAKAGAMKWIW